MLNRKIFNIVLLILITSCAQQEVEIIYKEENLNRYSPSYIKGNYINDKEKGIVRDLKLEIKKDLEQYEKLSNNTKQIIVKKGDTLIGIAKIYNASINDIIFLNKLNKPYNIYIGQKLKIGKNDNKANNQITNINKNINDKNYYIVKTGDNLFSIAKQNNTTFNNLVKLNNIKKPYNIYIGQKLLVTEDTNKKERINNNINNNIQSNNLSLKESKNDNLTKTISVINENEANTSKNNFIWPIKGEVITKFGDKVENKSFDGIAIKAKKGDNVLAIDDGEIVYAGNEISYLGNIVIVKHKNNWLSIYGYCNSTNVKAKDKIKKGSIVATIGTPKNKEEAQLYFSLRIGKNNAVDPLKYLD